MRLIVGLAFVFVAASAFAQTSPPLTSDQALGWLRGEWKVVRQQGRAAADRVVREYPQRFKAIKEQVTRVSQVVTQAADPRRLEEKKQLLLELWEARGSLDILALCSPDVIHQLTGLDTAAIASLEAQITRATKRLGG